jgi:hypothetical protein
LFPWFVLASLILRQGIQGQIKEFLVFLMVGVQLERLLPHPRGYLTIDPHCTVTSLIKILRPPALPQAVPITLFTKEDATNATNVIAMSTVFDPTMALVANVSREMVQVISSNPEVIQYTPA